jgi:hypothetical protein
VSRTRTIFIAVIVCLLIAFCYLATSYFKVTGLNKSLNTEISRYQQSLSELSVPDSRLPEILKESQRTNQALINSLAGGTESTTDVIDHILKDAEESNVTAIPLTSDNSGKKTIGDTQYNIIPVSLTVSGSFQDIQALLEKLENSVSYPSLILTDFKINNNSQNTAESAQATGTIGLAIVSKQAESQ